ncbi:hypothetical protein [Aureivirga sp. CE67]|uniref:hypothetical protein n=1 Tax=Aureivirga sp. CE67 TaxID=1788983 RepID=UPI0018C8E487|nr:hypothetical protein [Aureivirga sp. CE67]
MKEFMHYNTVSEAITELKKEGFVIDYNLKENCLLCEHSKYELKNYEIVGVYRYEGETDPSDEAAVYAIQEKGGDNKGVLVDGYGFSSNTSEVAEVLKELKFNKK